ncbi:MAG: hypothetical protein WC503_00070 [Candidatus Shapirobacteria bacterium]
MKKTFFYITLILIGILYFFLRFEKLSQNFVFRPDQGLHLLESYDMVSNHKIRLVGPLVSSKSFDNRNFFIGANYYYALAVLGILTKWNPISMTVLYGIIEFGFIMFFINWLRKKFNPLIALIVFLFLAISPYLISHSRFYWNPHFLLPLSILEVYFLDKYLKNKKKIYIFLSALIWGCAFAFHYAAILWGIIYLYIFIRKKLFSHLDIYLLTLSGFLLGDLPYFISEIKHNFYNIKTIFFVYSQSQESGQLFSHYFVYPFIIFFLFTIAFLLKKNWKNILYRNIIIASLIFITIIIPPVDELSAIPGWRYPSQLHVLKLILSNGCPQDYNVATTISGDTQSHDLRSLLNIKLCSPLSVDNYPQAKTIFLIAPPSRPPETETVWEVSSFRPFKVTEKTIINDNVILYRLDKTKAIL